MKKNYFLRYLFLAWLGVLTSALWGQTTTLNYTGNSQTFTAPLDGSYSIEAWGAQGGSGGYYSNNSYESTGGNGGYSYGEITLAAGQTIYIYVGGEGEGWADGVQMSTGYKNGGWNGGGDGAVLPGTGGGGATDFRVGGTAITDRVIVAGGGGGGGNASSATELSNGGAGGGLSGITLPNSTQFSGRVPGSGGTQITGYSLGAGEPTTENLSGAGGGGFYGGTSGDNSTGGGGGSGYIGGVTNGTTIAGNTLMPNPAGGTITGRIGNGIAVITRLCDNLVINASPSTTFCTGGEMVTLTASSTNGGTITWDNGITNGVPFLVTANTTYTASSTNFDDCTESVTITIDDITAPVAPTLADVTGECSATASASVTTTDDCAGIITGTTTDALTYSTQGTHIITWNFDDGNGNSIDVIQNVVIDDITVPVTPILSDVTGECSATAIAPTTTDACEGIITATTTDPLTYSTMGTHVITWNFDDGNGNAIDVTQNVVIVDLTAPVPMGFSSVAVPKTILDVNTITVDLNVSGLPLTLNTGDISSVCIDIMHTYDGDIDIQLISPLGTTLDLSLRNGGSGDNYSSTCFDMLALSNITLGSAPFLGSYIPEGAGGFDVFNGEDPNGTWQLSVTDNATVDVGTVNAFSMNFTNELSDVIAECEVTSLTAPLALDACSGTITGTTIDALSYTTQGTHVVTWNFDDGNGNSIDLTQDIIIDDTTDPVIPTLVDVTGECSATAGVPTTTDACAGTITGTTSDPLTYSTQGTHVIIWNFDDGNGNAIDVTQNVVIDDVTAPIQMVFNSVAVPVAIVDLNTITVDVNVTGLSNALNAGDLSSVCLDITHTYDSDLDIQLLSPQGTIFDLSLDNGGSGNNYSSTCFNMSALSNITLGTAPFSGSYMPQGTGGFDVFNGENPNGIWQLSVTDDAGADVGTLNAFSLNFTNVLSDIFAECEVTSFIAPTVIDACVGIITGTTTDPLSYTTQGTHVITWNFNDGNGNAMDVTQNVIIDDNINPVTPILLDVYTECMVTVELPTTTDACSGTITGTTTDPLTYSAQGIYSITWNFDDGNDNAIDVTQNVVIIDNTDPVMPTLLDVTAECMVTVVAPTTTDVCAGTITGTTTDPLTYSTQGIYSITWTFDDGNGNAINATQNVIVNDVTNPIAPILANVTGECSVTAVAPTVEDACVGILTGTTTDPLTYSAQGIYIITWNFDDGNGNAIDVSQNVVVDDVTNPVAPILADITAECMATAVTPTAEDACVGTITGTTTDALTYTVQGTRIITWSFDDGNGNVIDVTQNVVVDDVTNPIAPVLADITAECSATAVTPTAEDACVGTITGTTTDALTYTTQGTHVITWNFDDGNGNAIDVTQDVIITDLTAPVTPILADVIGECTATAVAPTTTDACSGTITGTTTDELSYITQGTFVITWNFADGNGNAINVTQNVVVNDVTNPVAPILADVTGECAATVVVPSTTDACSGTIIGTTTDPLTYTVQGTHVITWNFDDGNGNAIDVIQNVVVDDVTHPVAPVLADVTGECEATAVSITAEDGCVGTIIGTTTDPLTYTVQGTHIITWNFDDGNGNAIDVTQNVIVEDITAPIINVEVLETVTEECSATLEAPMATDNCDGEILGTTESVFPVTETTTVIWTYTDASENISTQTQEIVIEDVIAPVANLDVLETVTDECSVTLIAPLATDNCSGELTATTETVFPVTETTTVTWIYTDGAGNIATQTQDIVLEDVTAPVANLEVLETVTAECSETIDAPLATDNCEGEILGTTETVFPLTETTTVTWTYTDASGNASTQTQELVIEDVTAPLANLEVLETITAECSVTLEVPLATDNCDGELTATTEVIFPITETTTVTWTYTDVSGNVSTQTQGIVIEDVTAPVANLEVLETITEECSATIEAPLATDNCSGELTATTEVIFPVIETTTVTWTYTDVSGNASTQTQEIVIEDVIAPVANLEVLETVTAECSASLEAPMATDYCSGELSATTESIFPVTETTTVIWTYTDGAGNSSTQTQEIVIEDVTAPVANLEVLETVTVECSASLEAPMATDYCSGELTATTEEVFPVIETTTVTWTYTDGAGNASTQTQEIVIEDVTDPTIVCPENYTVMADNADNTYMVEGAILDPLSYDDNCGLGNIYNDFNNLSSLEGAVFNQGITEVVWIVEDATGNTTTCSFEVNIDEFVGIDELLSTTVFNVYPNPNNGQFRLNLSSELKGAYEIGIVNSIGVVVYSDEGVKLSKEILEAIKIENLASGIYYLNIQFQNSSLQKKIVIID